MKIGILGPSGTFSEVAFLQYINNQNHIEKIYYQTLEETTQSLKVNDKIIVPLENMLEGYVQQILDFLIDEDVFIEQELYVDVQFELIYKNNLSDISNIFVQFAAKGQCQNFIKSLSSTDLTLTASNTQSLNLYLHNPNHNSAIVPSHLIPNGYLHQNVTDSKYNQTRFIVISKKQEQYTSKNLKVSLAVIPSLDRPGLLYDILSIFNAQNINLTSIMSRPQKNMMGKYFFFIEFDANDHILHDINKLIEFTKKSYTIKILGIYPKK